MRLIADLDPELDTLTVKAAAIAARIRAHDRFCRPCSGAGAGPRPPCERRRQLERLQTAAGALVNARRRALSRP